MKTPAKKPPKEQAPKPKRSATGQLMGKDQPAHWCGKKGRSGAQNGVGNNIRHGLKSANLPKGCRYIYHRICALRRTLEAAVLNDVGEINLKDAAAINTAIRQERNAQLAEHYARHNQGKLPDAVILDFYERAAKSSAERDKKIAALPICREAKDTILAALYKQLPAPKEGTDETP